MYTFKCDKKLCCFCFLLFIYFWHFDLSETIQDFILKEGVLKQFHELKKYILLWFVVKKMVNSGSLNYRIRKKICRWQLYILSDHFGASFIFNKHIKDDIFESYYHLNNFIIWHTVKHIKSKHFYMFVFCAQSPMLIRSKYHSEQENSIYPKEINSLDKRVYNMLDYFDKSFYHDTTHAMT